MKKCLICGQLTEGSVGVAGIKWSNICQPCKNKEDKALADAITAQAKVMDWVLGKI